MHHFHKMSVKPQKKKKNLLTKPKAKRADEMMLCEFVTLADQLRFESDKIFALKQWSLNRKIAYNALLKAQKSDHFDYSDALFKSHIV